MSIPAIIFLLMFINCLIKSLLYFNFIFQTPLPDGASFLIERKVVFSDNIPNWGGGGYYALKLAFSNILKK